MSNTINITACDNQLVLFAVTGSASYEICNIQSGNYNTVLVDINLQAGDYAGPVDANGVNSAIDLPNQSVSLPAGTYTLLYSGINWGGPYNFKFTFGGVPYELTNDPSKPLFGVIWNKGDNEIQFTVA